jgi:hypothetical protein
MPKLYNEMKIRLAGKLNLIMKMIPLLILFASIASQLAFGNTISSAICDAYTTITDVIFVFAILMVVLGASLYAGANLMSSQLKGTMQGYGIGMVSGGVVGIIIVVVAPYILNLIVTIASGTNGSLELDTSLC